MKRFFLLIGAPLALVVACSLPFGTDDVEQVEPPVPTGTSKEPAATATRPPVAPVEDKWDLWTSGVHLRGVDMHPCRLFTAGDCAQLITRQDIQELRNLGANLINASYPGVFTVEPPYQVDSDTLGYLDDLAGWAEEVGIYVVIHFRTGPGRSEGAIHQERGALNTVWSDQAAQDAWVEMWRFTAERYRDVSVVAGYDLMVEPLPNRLIDSNGEQNPTAVQAQSQGTLMDWNAFAAEMTAAIRQVDPETPIIVSSLNWASAEWFSALQPTGDPRTIYSLHAYDPDVYTNQEEGETDIRYPDVVEDYGETITFDNSWLEDNYQPVYEFARQHDVPIYVGEFGVYRWVPDAVTFLHDQTDLFEQYGWNYAVYVWRGDEPDFDGFNLEYGSNPEAHSPVPNNPLLGVILDRWAQNVDFPGEPVAAPDAPTSLADVRNWLYLIDVDLEPGTVDQIAASSYDMAVLDFIPSEENNTDYPMAEVINRLHNADHPKLVIAYIDIGQAENYRTYWQPGWRIGDPDWIITSDPDGWEGNFPVAYWYDEYKDIWLGSGGYLQSILDVGFDGVYLDWVEAYSDEDVVDLAESENVDPVQEMIWWVSDIAEFVRSQDPDFIVIGQNAAELAENDEYVEIIDAIAQEQVWFDGGADNDPPGDCPLPRTEEDVDTDAYRDSLSGPCRRQYDQYPDSTLHVSGEWYLNDLTLALSKGLVIFTVDYALDPVNVSWVSETSRELGFIPFVGNRALDRFVEPVP